MSVVTRIRIKEEVDVPFPPREVWNVLIDVASYPRWWPKSLDVSVLNLKPGLLGTEIEVRPRFGRTYRFRFEEMEEPYSLRFRYFGGALEGPGGFHLEAEDGSTRAVYEVDVFARGLDTAVLSWIFPFHTIRAHEMRSVLRKLGRRVRSEHERAALVAAEAARIAGKEAEARLAAEEAKRLVATRAAQAEAARIEAKRAAEEAERQVDEEAMRVAAKAAAEEGGRIVAALAAEKEAARAKEEKAIRAAEEEAARIEAKRFAEEAARRAEEEAARAAAKAAAEEAERLAAARAAEEEAARVEAKLIAEEAERLAAARAAEEEAARVEGKRIAEEAERRAAEEAARAAVKAAAEEAERLAAARAAEEEEARVEGKRIAEEAERRAAEDAASAAVKAAAEEAERLAAARAAEEEEARVEAERAAEEAARAAAKAAAEEPDRLEIAEGAPATAAGFDETPNASRKTGSILRRIFKVAEDWLFESPGTPSRPLSDALDEQQVSNFDTARAYLAALSSPASAEEIGRFFAEDAVQEEFPQRFLARETSRAKDGIVAARDRDLHLYRTQNYELIGATGGGSQVAMEIRFNGLVAHPTEGRVEGQELEARAAVFLKFKNGKIARQRTYACFEPWSRAEEKATLAGSRAAAFDSRLGESKAPDAPRRSNPSKSNFEMARAYLEALSSGAGDEAVAAFYAPDAIQEEFPNRFLPSGASRNLDGIRQARIRGLTLLASEHYDLRSATGGGSQVALEIQWTGVVRTSAGPFTDGQKLESRSAVFLKFRDGLIVRQRNYDCV